MFQTFQGMEQIHHLVMAHSFGALQVRKICIAQNNPRNTLAKHSDAVSASYLIIYCQYNIAGS